MYTLQFEYVQSCVSKLKARLETLVLSVTHSSFTKWGYTFGSLWLVLSLNSLGLKHLEIIALSVHSTGKNSLFMQLHRKGQFSLLLCYSALGVFWRELSFHVSLLKHWKDSVGFIPALPSHQTHTDDFVFQNVGSSSTHREFWWTLSFCFSKGYSVDKGWNSAFIYNVSS